MRAFNRGPPGGRLLPPPKLRLSDLDGGVFGPGASASHIPHVTGGSNSQTQQEWEDLLEYHHFHAERGDVAYMFRLGRLYYQGFGGGGLGGPRGTPSLLKVGEEPFVDKFGSTSEGGRNFLRASQWFMRVARGVWPKDLREAMENPMASKSSELYNEAKDVKLKTDEHHLMVAGLAAGFLGRMYLRGEGVKADEKKAFLWFTRGIAQVRSILFLIEYTSEADLVYLALLGRSGIIQWSGNHVPRWTGSHSRCSQSDLALPCRLPTRSLRRSGQSRKILPW